VLRVNTKIYPSNLFVCHVDQDGTKTTRVNPPAKSVWLDEPMQTVKARLIVKNVKVENLPTKRKNHRVNHAPKGHGATKKD